MLDKLPVLQCVVKFKEHDLNYADNYFDIAKLIAGLEYFMRDHAYNRRIA